jgi:hypothetical protein
MMKMFTANAIARTDGCVTFAMAVFDGPVLKKRRKSATNMNTHASGNGTNTIAAETGNAIITPIAETRK